MKVKNPAYIYILTFGGILLIGFLYFCWEVKKEQETFNRWLNQGFNFEETIRTEEKRIGGKERACGFCHTTLVTGKAEDVGGDIGDIPKYYWFVVDTTYEEIICCDRIPYSADAIAIMRPAIGHEDQFPLQGIEWVYLRNCKIESVLVVDTLPCFRSLSDDEIRDLSKRLFEIIFK